MSALDTLGVLDNTFMFFTSGVLRLPFLLPHVCVQLRLYLSPRRDSPRCCARCRRSRLQLGAASPAIVQVECVRPRHQNSDGDPRAGNQGGPNLRVHRQQRERALAVICAACLDCESLMSQLSWSRQTRQTENGNGAPGRRRPDLSVAGRAGPDGHRAADGRQVHRAQADRSHGPERASRHGHVGAVGVVHLGSGPY
jgi:hypothetical protein